MENKALTLLGFASKAGKLGYGMTACTAAVKSGKAKLAAVSFEVSEKSRKEIAFHCEKKGVKVLILDDFDIQTVSNAVGRKCGIVSVNDSSFAAAVLSAAQDGRKCNDK